LTGIVPRQDEVMPLEKVALFGGQREPVSDLPRSTSHRRPRLPVIRCCRSGDRKCRSTCFGTFRRWRTAMQLLPAFGSCCSRASDIYASACVCDSYESLVQVLLFDAAFKYLSKAGILCTDRSYRNWFCEVLHAVQWSAAFFESLIVLSFSVVRLIAIRRPLQVCVVDFSPLFRGPVPNTNPGRLSD